MKGVPLKNAIYYCGEYNNIYQIVMSKRLKSWNVNDMATLASAASYLYRISILRVSIKSVIQSNPCISVNLYQYSSFQIAYILA